jgi:hypothetical protein
MSGKTFHLQDYWHMCARGLVDLYAGEGARLFAYYQRRWPALRRSGILAGRVCSQQLHWLRAGAAIAAVATTEKAGRHTLLATAERDARRLGNNPVLGSEPMAWLVHAAIAHARRDVDQAAGRLDRAAASFDALDMRSFAAAARRQLGGLRGGDEGKALVEAADAFMTSEGVVNPTKFARMLAPGFGSNED